MMEISGFFFLVACFICRINFTVTSEFMIYQLTTDHTCEVSDVIPFPGPTRSVLECAVGCLKVSNGSNLCYNNGTSTCTCCSATNPSGPSTTKCYQQQECGHGHGWTKAGGLCLFAHSELKDFTECKNACDASGGKILTPENLEQISDAMTFIEGNPGTLDGQERYWLGVSANTTEPERSWYYSDTGNVVTYFNWRLGEPNGHTPQIKEYCVIGMDNPQWSDVPCTWSISCVCQIRL